MATSPSPRLYNAVIDGRYTIRQKLGSGSLGTVYLAQDEEKRRSVALKIIRTEQMISPSRSPMQNEFRAIALLSHPQIAKAYDFGYTEAGIPYYTREYVRGSPLPPGPPRNDPPSKFLRPILDLLEALGYLHSQRVLHLDIHAGNLIVADDEERGSVLIDIGLVRSPQKPFFSVKGDAWPVLPPELLEGRSASVTTDLFLVGRFLHYRLTGQTQGKPGLPKEIPGWGTRLTLDLERILVRALQYEPEQRFQSAEEFRDALYKILGESCRSSKAAEPRQIIIGRDRELNEIEKTLQAAARGSAAFLWLVGKAGLGKTRLLSEARLRAQLRGLSTVEVRFLADAGPESVLIQSLQRLKSPRGGKVAWLRPLDPRCGGTPRERAQRAAEAYFRQEEKPAVILLDDLDLADRHSRELAEALVSNSLQRQKEGLEGRGLALFLAGSKAPSAKVVPREDQKKSVSVLRELSLAESRELFLALMRPLSPPEPLILEAAREARGVPLYLRQITTVLRRQWKDRSVIPDTARLPELKSTLPGSGCPDVSKLSPVERMILEVLSVIGRAANRAELSSVLASTSLSEESIARSLRHLVRLEILVARGRGQARLYQLSRFEWASTCLKKMRPPEVEKIHADLIAYLRQELPTARGKAETRFRESLARHVLAVGKREEGHEEVLRAAECLRKSGAFDRAVRLLEEGVLKDRNARKRFQLAELIGSISEETGDYEKGIEVFEPFYRGESGPLSPAKKVRVRRHLGYHYHQAGFPEKALKAFKEAQALAVPERDAEDLVFIDSELAELHIFLGSYDAAEEACRKGLQRIEQEPGREEFLGRMKVLLRASLGHIQMRRLNLSSAREELLKALDLTRRCGRLSDRAAILHNLGVTESQRNEFLRARRFFSRAEDLLKRAGKHRDVIKICTNQALIEAKLGHKNEAKLQIEKATEMLRHYPGQRFECFAAYSRGIVHHLFGETEAAAEALEQSVAFSERLGDISLKDFGLLYLAETQMLSGRYSRALDFLQSASASLENYSAPILERSVLCHMYLVETVLGRSRRALGCLDEFENIPRTDVLYLEIWNDLFLALGKLLSGEHPMSLIESATGTFDHLQVEVGRRFGRLLLLLHGLMNQNTGIIKRSVESLITLSDSSNLFLRVAEPLALAEGLFAVGDFGQSEKWLTAASGAIVGSPFLELDAWLELLRTRIALQHGDLREARRHLHRCLHSRDLLLQFVPEGARSQFTSQSRFAVLRQTTERISTSPALEISTERLRRSRSYEGMIGYSPVMLDLFQTLERIRGQDLTVLITGETGTGKELVARAIHQRGPRHQRPFQSVSCACLSPELFESEFFGHAAGAFTSADQEQKGILESASGGTLLLDEISLLPLESQAKLLRILDSGVIRPLGSMDEKRLDVRFLATTSTRLREVVSEKRFREDLFYRLSGVEVRVPPLRERREDIVYISKYFLEKHAARLDRAVPVLEPDGVSFLEDQPWPGNVRELEMLLLRAMIKMPDPVQIGARDLELLVGEGSSLAPQEDQEDLTQRDLKDLRRDLERKYLRQLFFKAGGDTRQMMRDLGIQSTKLYYWLHDLGLDIRTLRKELRGR